MLSIKFSECFRNILMGLFTTLVNHDSMIARVSLGGEIVYHIHIVCMVLTGLITLLKSC